MKTNNNETSNTEARDYMLLRMKKSKAAFEMHWEKTGRSDGREWVTEFGEFDELEALRRLRDCLGEGDVRIDPDYQAEISEVLGGRDVWPDYPFRPDAYFVAWLDGAIEAFEEVESEI